MLPASRIVVSRSPPVRVAPFEICEHKGIGHPDSLCDGVAEAVSRALCRAYIRAYGAVQHYNVDKALLVGGQSEPRFGGGKLVVPPRMIVCGRATALPDIEMDELVRGAARAYLGSVLHCEPGLFAIESLVRSGSPNLQRVVPSDASPRANDTSFGTGFAPYATLERFVLRTAEVLRSPAFRARFAAAGDDFKIMGARSGEEQWLTIALAFVDNAVDSASAYRDIKADMVDALRADLRFHGTITINALDDPAATDVEGLYLTVTGLSAEHGDDGQVGRGNRVNGLITPGRPMSLEAAAGKNAVAHVGKLYNVLAHRIAHALVDGGAGLSDVSVQLLSTIGDPIDEPALVAVQVATDRRGGMDDDAIRTTVVEHLARLGPVCQQLLAGEVAVF